MLVVRFGSVTTPWPEEVKEGLPKPNQDTAAMFEGQ